VEQNSKWVKRNNFDIEGNKEHARQQILDRKTPPRCFNLLNAAFIGGEFLWCRLSRSKDGCHNHHKDTKENRQTNQNKNGE
jgi:hypothetical protein